MGNSDYHTGVVAITRNGLGDIYLFDTFEDADVHPVVQYGDVICRGPSHIMKQFTYLELPDLLRRLGDESLRNEILTSLTTATNKELLMSRYEDAVWRKMCECSSSLPETAGATIELIINDRKLTLKERRMNTTAATATTATTATTAKAPAEAKDKMIAGFKPDAKITLLVDKDGKPYGKDNNPKREGSASAARFANYKNDMTVQQASDAGLGAADIKNDVEKKFIQVK